MSLLELSLAVGGLGLGLALGWVACYFTQVRALQQQVFKMRREGFLPHFDEDELSSRNQATRHPAEEVISREH